MQLQIYTDGACDFCRALRAKVEPYDTRGLLRFLDYNDSDVAATTPFSREELAEQMHVRTPEGRWVKGYFGWIAILKVLPRGKWLGRLLAAPPLRWAGPLLYRAVAANRYRFFGLPPPCDTFCSTGRPRAASR